MSFLRLRVSLFLLSTLLLPSGLAQQSSSPEQKCGKAPLAIPLQIVQGRRGVPIQIGQPPQMVVLDILPNSNETHVVGASEDCSTGSECQRIAGGTFDPKISLTYKAGEEEGTGFDTIEFIKPEMNLGENFPFIHSLPSEVDGKFVPGISGIGFGNGSTFMRTMKENDLVDSEVWSLDWGMQQRNGELILGGANPARYDEDADELEIEMSTGECELSVDVQEVALKDVSNSTQFSACVSPDFLGVAVPNQVFDQFNASLGGIIGSRTEEGFLVKAGEINSSHSLTLTLAANFTVTIPHHQLFILDSRSQEQTYTLRLFPSSIPRLGQPFLSTTYLTVSHPSRTFTLRPTLPTPLPSKPLISLPQNTPCFNLNTNPPADASKKPGLPRHILIVILAASATFILLVLLTVFLFLFRRRRAYHYDPRAPSPLTHHKPPPPPHLPSPEASYPDKPIGGPRFSDVEKRLPWAQDAPPAEPEEPARTLRFEDVLRLSWRGPAGLDGVRVVMPWEEERDAGRGLAMGTRVLRKEAERGREWEREVASRGTNRTGWSDEGTVVGSEHAEDLEDIDPATIGRAL